MILLCNEDTEVLTIAKLISSQNVSMFDPSLEIDKSAFNKSTDQKG